MAPALVSKIGADAAPVGVVEVPGDPVGMFHEGGHVTGLVGQFTAGFCHAVAYDPVGVGISAGLVVDGGVENGFQPVGMLFSETNGGFDENLLDFGADASPHGGFGAVGPMAGVVGV